MPSWNDNSANLSDRENALRAELAGGGALPAGGSTGQALIKNSGTDGDASWKGFSAGNPMSTHAVVSSTNPFSYAAINTDRFIPCDCTTGRVQVTLPNPVGNTGYTVTIRKTDSTTKNVFVLPFASESLDGVAPFVSSGVTIIAKLTQQYQELTVASDGTNWQHVAGNSALPASTEILYVDATNGNDSNTGQFPWGPKKTIGAAVTAAPNNTLISIAPGSYVETVAITNKQFITLAGYAPGGGGLPLGAGPRIVAPSDAVGCITLSGSRVTIRGLQLLGNGSGTSCTYTGTLLDCTGGNIGCRFEDLELDGAPGDITGAKGSVGKGTYGGTGILLNNFEQAIFNNITINNCHIAVSMPGTLTCSKNELRNFHFGQNWITFQDGNQGGPAGGNIFYNWKSQDCFALTYAIAHISTNGSNPADGDTVLVRNVTYRFKNTMAQANDVKIGATIDATLLSLVHAANGTGTPGTDYFAGTAQPTGIRAGYMNLVDYGASGGNGWNQDVVDTTHHACTFQVQDVVGPSGNAYTFTVTSTNLTDYLGLGTFGRADWNIQTVNGNHWECVDTTENISLPIGNCVLVGSNGARFLDFVTAPQTTLSVTGNVNYFLLPQFQNSVNVQTGATGNVFELPFSGTGTSITNAAKITDSGLGTVIRLAGRSARAPLAITYSASMTPNIYQAEDFIVTATNGTAFAINAPSVGGSSDVVNGMTMTVMIRNTSGGALGVVTWNAIYKMAAWTQPANGFGRTITFRYDGTNWIEMGRTATDVPN